MTKPRRPVRLTAVSVLHYVRLVYRAALFAAVAVYYVIYLFQGGEDVASLLERRPVILAVVWCVFTVEMVLRFFPSALESPGCQKQFARNYRKTGSTDIHIQDNNAAVMVALVWIAFNGVFGALHMLDVLDDGAMILLSLAYSVCDMICILFFCPFQTWFLKNKCCATCRIYNWDYAMMFTPLFFVRSAYSWSLLALSVGLLARWEITLYKYPERFSERTNGYLACAVCTEKLCAHKNQLKSLWRHVAEFTERRVRKLRGDGK
ncbi:MAG: hypothetical protein II458_02990 [Oscillospiraceae bacterium]|nr:hypothetical protein [Oscillospiraceae bacterium]